MTVILASETLMAEGFQKWPSCIISKISNRRGLIFRLQQPLGGADRAGGNGKNATCRSNDIRDTGKSGVNVLRDSYDENSQNQFY